MLNEIMAALLKWWRWRQYKPTPPRLNDHRSKNQDVAVVFLHGFSGNGDTWNGFIKLLMQDQRVDSWDIFGICYPTALRIDISNLWAADPDIETLATGLVTTLSLPPFDRFKCVALIAHSMGGLVVQRAIVDSPTLAARLSHVILFGTPSAGLEKASFAAKFKRQLRDMASSGTFIKRLRADWTERIGATPKFEFLTLQGDRDEFVSKDSSLIPFPDPARHVIPGNHLEIIRPSDATHQGFQLVVKALAGQTMGRPFVDGARLAVELGDFRAAVDTLLPRVASLDDAALVSLALALDGLGRSAEALTLLEYHCRHTSSEALGVLGGRIKRRWLTERSNEDLLRARELYQRGLEISEAAGDPAQAYYHAINIAFLDLLSAPATSRVPITVRTMAQRALVHCQNAEQNHWNLATQGEAYLMLDDLTRAEVHYRRAIVTSDSQRSTQSMYSQALIVAIRVAGRNGGRFIESVFGVAQKDAIDLLKAMEND
jgi:pimeloyl-ACP methyl ester carboxylesterase